MARKESQPANYRKRDDEGKIKIESADLVHVLLVPGICGIIASYLLGRIIISAVHSVGDNHNGKQILGNMAKILNRDLGNLMTLDFSDPSIWYIVVCGFALGIFIRHVFKDETIR